MEQEKFNEIIEIVDSMNIDDSDKVQILNFISSIIHNKMEEFEINKE